MYEDDYAGDDLLVDQKFTISGDTMPIYVDLKKISASKGDDTARLGSIIIIKK
ncbi:hypothetical protein [Flavobacterium sp.]|uniref:hypothetical protein n=1 Tax=Flavobacterium sp. TaxID=239 RepID=UPI00286E4315|nr:hypothetical protein [Flavobacterium sp.]